MSNEKLIELANQVKQNAYSPYFNFRVGACVLTKSGKTFVGCNVENGAGSSICAERVAVSQAIAQGEKEFVKIAVVSDRQDLSTYPCGVCRQFLAEFGEDIEVVMPNKNGVEVKTIKELLPHTFKL